MATRGEWIANCLPDRVERIAAASVFLLRVGPPQPNQMQNLADLLARGVVGLYRQGKKPAEQAQSDQRTYLAQSDFLPSPAVLLDFLGPHPDLGPD